MAKVKIQGNASGTGVLTVTAPNTSTDRTITLPDSTDTLAVNSDVTNKLPLAGGTMSGNLIVNASVNAAGSGTGGGFHFADGNAMIYRDTNDMVFKLQGAEKIRLLSSGGISFNGDTAGANALDDYEEGSGNSSQIAVKLGGTALTVSGVGYTYTKIGNIVHFQFEFRIENLNGASSGSFTIGLPFSTISGGYSAGAIRIYNGVVDGNEFIGTSTSGDVCYIKRRVNNSGTANVTATNNAYYFGQITYTTS